MILLYDNADPRVGTPFGVEFASDSIVVGVVLLKCSLPLCHALFVEKDKTKY